MPRLQRLRSAKHSNAVDSSATGSDGRFGNSPILWPRNVACEAASVRSMVALAIRLRRQASRSVVVKLCAGRTCCFQCQGYFEGPRGRNGVYTVRLSLKRAFQGGRDGLTREHSGRHRCRRRQTGSVPQPLRRQLCGRLQLLISWPVRAGSAAVRTSSVRIASRVGNPLEQHGNGSSRCVILVSLLVPVPGVPSEVTCRRSARQPVALCCHARVRHTITGES